MQRDYRGKRVDNGEWVYGWYVFENGLHGIMTSSKNNNFLIWNEVIPESVGQYIEKDDRNGKNIYVGDIIEANIIEWHLPTMGIIVFDATLSSYGNKNDAGITLLHKLDSIKVIGNIYENPELLEGK